LHDFSLSHTDFDDTEDGVMLSSDLDESATSFALACEECESRTMNCDVTSLGRRLGSHAIGIFVATDHQ
jgi:hypothetical protein